MTEWSRGRGENCYFGHGATELEATPGSSCGLMPLEACKQKCLNLSGCTGITVEPSSHDSLYFCYRRKDIVFGECVYNTTFDTYVRKHWYPALGFNCYSGHGAIDIDGESPCLIGSIQDCQSKCNNTTGCSGVVFTTGGDSGFGNCFRKGGNISLSKCDRKTKNYDTYLKGIE